MYYTLIACLLMTSCVKEVTPQEEPVGKQVTIRVAMDEETFTKVSFTPQDGKLALAWENTDCIRVISGKNSAVFTLSKIIDDHVAEFTGTEVEGSSFNILFPGTYASVEEAESDTVSPAQEGNGSSAHLRYRALLSGVDSYENVGFTEAWASSHGGTLKQGAAIKFKATLPGGVSTLSKAVIRLGDTDYTLPLTGVDVSASAQVLTAYMMLPWEDIALGDGSIVPVYVMDTDKEVYSAALTISGDKVVRCGKMNSFQGITLSVQNFVAGNGSAENPYVIANARQLNNMSGVLVADETKYFRLMGDVDASSIANWTPLNTASGFKKAMDFDGAGYTISNLKSSGANYASFAGVLNGHIHNLTFDKATITHTSKIGVVGGFIGTSGVVGNCTDVHVINSTVTGTGTTWAGGFAGEINTTGTLLRCSVENTTVTAKSHVGEFAGMVRVQASTIKDCYTRNFTLAHNSTPSATTGLGGFVGCTTINPTFDNCYVEGPVTLSSNVTVSGDVKVEVGGFIGYSTPSAAPTFKDCYVEGPEINISGNAEVGGFVGYGDKSANYTGCRVTKVAVSGVSHLGGFLGYGTNTSYEVPSIFTDCHVQDVTVTQNLATANGSIHTGGFVGYSMQALSYINCSVSGTTVNATKAAVQNVGGFVGCTYHSGSNFQGCVVDNTTSVTGQASSVGGFVGWSVVPDTYKDCSSAATVNNTGENTGGFAGKVAGAATFTNCWAGGNVVNDANNTAGFAGYAENASFTGCHYENGTVTNTKSSARVGGFVGTAGTAVGFNGCYVSGATIAASIAGRTGGFAGQLGANSAGGNDVSAEQCYVTGTSVSGAQNTGGFVGVQYESTSRCYVEGGSVTANNTQVGGFTAYLQNTSAENCYTTTTVNGGAYDHVGGFVGNFYQGSISNCYSAGTQNGTGANRAAFVAQCLNASGSISNCIGWNASLPFYGANTAGATLTDNYAGADGTISSRAGAQSGWSTAIWNLDDAQPVLKPGSLRIPAVFVGDSITWQWAKVSRKEARSSIVDATHGVLGNDPLPDYMSASGSNIIIKFHPGFFSSNGYIDKGISGQNTTQMRDRFAKDVLALNPKVFVVMGGTNDIAQEYSYDDIYNNIAYMASEAKAAGIKVVVCSITPNNRNYSKVGWKSVHIEEMNSRYQALCASEGYTYCDYWSALVALDETEAAVATDIGHGLKDKYKLYDDLHPGPDAYTVMEGIIKPIIDGLL